MNAARTENNVRPWGRYEILDDGAGYKVKRITVDPGQRFSYQRHGKRSEHWTIVDGEALVTLEGTALRLSSGQTVTIPVGAKHRAKNEGSAPLVFIEVQVGQYLGEDDIERFEDDYGRAAAS